MGESVLGIVSVHLLLLYTHFSTFSIIHMYGYRYRYRTYLYLGSSVVVLKVPKREIFVTEFFILSDPIWVGDLRNEPKKPFV